MNINGPQLAVSGKGGDCGFVHIAVIGTKPIEHLCHNGGVNGGVEFVGFHGGKRGKTRSQAADAAPDKDEDAGGQCFLAKAG